MAHLIQLKSTGAINNMPLTKKGGKIMRAMSKEYGAKKGKQVFYASKNAGKITKVEKKKK